MANTSPVALLKEKILDKRPVLRETFDRYAGMSVSKYADLLIADSQPADLGRQREFIAAIAAEAGRHFPKPLAESIAAQLRGHYFVSTAEHHGPLVHPFFVHANLLAIGQGLAHTILLAVGNVSLNNSSYPRGLLFHGADGTTHQLPLFSAKRRSAPVFQHRPFNREDLNRAQKNLKNKIAAGSLAANLGGRVGELVEEVYGSPGVLAKPRFSDQVTVTNELLRQKFFKNSGVMAPNLVMLQLEDVVLKLLLDHHIFVTTEIAEILFNPHRLEEVIKVFDGIPGNFSIKEKKGTFLFWFLSQKTGWRERLWPHQGKLESEYGYSVALRPDDIAAAISRGELMPSTFLSLLLLSEYYGVKCLGGFTQGTYLTQLHQAYQKMTGAVSAFPDDHTKGLRSDFLIGYFRSATSKLVGASGIDLALHNREQSWTYFKQSMENLTIEEAMAPLFPELYRALYSPEAQDMQLSKITTDDIITYYKLGEKVTPCIDIT